MIILLRDPANGIMPICRGNLYSMLSIPDMAILGGLALIVFGPERLPQIARQVGRVIGEVRSTSASFVSEMERAASVTPTVAVNATDSVRHENRSDVMQPSIEHIHAPDPAALPEDAHKS